MDFNSYSFIFVCLPLSVYGFFCLAKQSGKTPALAYLLLCSLGMYALRMGVWTGVALFSVGFNYSIGALLQHRPRKPLLALGVGIAIGILAFFKYGVFFFPQSGLIFPLALSFFTFQQIAYLVDSYRQTFLQKPTLLEYTLGVFFFPLLTAGPITRHAKLIPQWEDTNTFAFNPYHCSLGVSLFVLGLFKKVIVADGWFAPTADLLFGSLKHGVNLSFIEAWMATLSYTFQIYFDFSGYSEMALGLGYCFNIQLPLNFNAPYKSASIIEFWRSWHMSLSSFLKDYIYIPLGGNRCGRAREILNIFTVMVIGGIWHGASLNFIAWGALHGVYVTLNHLWRKLQRVLGLKLEQVWLWSYAMQGLTFLAVALGWILFRADSLPSALILFKGLFGMNAFLLPLRLKEWVSLQELFPSLIFSKMGFILQDPLSVIYRLLKGFGIIWLLPSVPEIFHLVSRTRGPFLNSRLLWRPNWLWAIGLALLFVYTVFSLQGYRGQFVYYQF